MSRSSTGLVSPSRLILFLPVALVLIWLILRQTVILMLAERPDLPLVPLWPVSGATVIGQTDVRSLAAMRANPAVASRLQQALVDDPLASEPYYAAALVAIRQRDRTAAIGLLEQARRREPRWQAVRLLLAQQYVLAGRIEGAVEEIAALTRLDTSVRGQLIEALIPLSNDARSRPAVIAALSRDAKLRQAFVEYVARKGGDPTLLFKSLVSAPQGHMVADQQAAVVGMLVASADYQRAYLAWINFLPQSALSGIAFIYDGNFTGLPGPPPFNWRLVDEGSGNSELVRRSSLPQGTALEVNYFSEQPATLAEQLVVLEPGSYVFSYSVTGSRDSDTGGGLAWSLRCLGQQGPELLRSGLLPSQPTKVDVRFTVPAAGCAAQMLSLLGASSDVPTSIRAEYSGLTVSRQSPPAPPAGQQGGSS